MTNVRISLPSGPDCGWLWRSHGTARFRQKALGKTQPVASNETSSGGSRIAGRTRNLRRNHRPGNRSADRGEIVAASQTRKKARREEGHTRAPGCSHPGLALDRADEGQTHPTPLPIVPRLPPVELIAPTEHKARETRLSPGVPADGSARLCCYTEKSQLHTGPAGAVKSNLSRFCTMAASAITGPTDAIAVYSRNALGYFR